MTGVDVRPVDRDSATERRAYWEAGRDAVADRPYNEHIAWQAADAYLQVPRHDVHEVRLGAWLGDRLVGTRREPGRPVRGPARLRRRHGGGQQGPRPHHGPGPLGRARRGDRAAPRRLGEAAVDLEVLDEERVRTREERAARAGRRDVFTFALDGLGEVVALTAAYPGVEWVLTGNADVNAPMNAINDRLGFRVVERCLHVRGAVAG